MDERYQVAIPWKDDESELPDNYEMAVRRLFNTELEWPINRVNVDQETKSMEIKNNDRKFQKQANDHAEERTMISLKEDNRLWRLNPNRFSSWQKFIRVQAWVYRFIKKLQTS